MRRTTRERAMPHQTVSVRLPVETKARLDELAKKTGRPASLIAERAVAAYVASELKIVEGIERGLADMRAGRVTPREEVLAHSWQRSEARRVGQEGFSTCRAQCSPHTEKTKTIERTN